jgi:hypothetical protein
MQRALAARGGSMARALRAAPLPRAAPGAAPPPPPLRRAASRARAGAPRATLRAHTSTLRVVPHAPRLTQRVPHSSRCCHTTAPLSILAGLTDIFRANDAAPGRNGRCVPRFRAGCGFAACVCVGAAWC